MLQSKYLLILLNRWVNRNFSVWTDLVYNWLYSSVLSKTILQPCCLLFFITTAKNTVFGSEMFCSEEFTINSCFVHVTLPSIVHTHVSCKYIKVDAYVSVLSWHWQAGRDMRTQKSTHKTKTCWSLHNSEYLYQTIFIFPKL